MTVDGPMNREGNTKAYMTSKNWVKFYMFPESAGESPQGSGNVTWLVKVSSWWHCKESGIPLPMAEWRSSGTDGTSWNKRLSQEIVTN